MKKYEPIGTQWTEITTICGKAIPKFLQYEFAETYLNRAKAEYGNVKISSYPVDTGHTNRDGDHTSSSYTVYQLLKEGPRYSNADYHEMLKEEIMELLRSKGVKTLFKNPSVK